ncbi:hypothetical protein GCM10007242_16730 [Pigmentiphaga litoralis]|uniref:nuclease domain-containing protein n=1 Tax=Pigmentiphaga litoralis TaxID=516702 RepID=UPI0019BD06B1|nr:nuclease domain-containing protein [Pigmentiphaga litoralis]GGX11289.1 hypothetical protein GCM10007242_16730 [Pigmentiphaga litoralis]
MLKQRTPMTRKTPMKRTAIARPTGAPKITARRKPKARPGRDQVALDVCRGEACYLRINSVCLGSAGAATVVPAHSNQAVHGKGKGIKAHDRYSLPACHACHAEIDSGNRMTRTEKALAWDAAYFAWEPVRAQRLTALGKTLSALPISKIVPRGDHL